MDLKRTRHSSSEEDNDEGDEDYEEEIEQNDKEEEENQDESDIEDLYVNSDNDYQEEENNINDRIYEEQPIINNHSSDIVIDSEQNDDECIEYAKLLSKITTHIDDDTVVDNLTMYKKGLPFCPGETDIDDKYIIDGDLIFLKLSKQKKVPPKPTILDLTESRARVERLGLSPLDLEIKIAKVKYMAQKFGIGEIFAETHPVIVREENDLILRWVEDDLDKWTEQTCPLCYYEIDPPDPYMDGSRQISKQIKLFFMLLIQALRSTNRVIGFDVTAKFWNVAISKAFGECGITIQHINKSLIEWHCYHTPYLRRVLNQYRIEDLSYLAIDSLQRNGLFLMDQNNNRAMTEKAISSFCRLGKSFIDATDRTICTEMAMVATGRLQAMQNSVTLKSALREIQNIMKEDRFGIKGGNEYSGMIENKHGT